MKPDMPAPDLGKKRSPRATYCRRSGHVTSITCKAGIPRLLWWYFATAWDEGLFVLAITSTSCRVSPAQEALASRLPTTKLNMTRPACFKICLHKSGPSETVEGSGIPGPPWS